MLFNSYIFIFLFLPLCLGGFYVLQKRYGLWAKGYLTAASLWFYGYFNPSYLAIMLFSIGINYGFHRGLAAKVSGNVKKGAQAGSGLSPEKLLAVGIGSNLLVLFYFKYYDFFLENVNLLFGSKLPLQNIVLPLGISFFTFQQISFLADTYRGNLKECSFVDYALFVSFFPQLIAGPIVTQGEMLPQFARIGGEERSREERLHLLVSGIYLFTLGLAKKVLLADTFGIAVDYAYGNVEGLNALESLLTVVMYSIQLYFDFSGYCDMAKGLGRMFGIHITDNFDSPYRAGNIVEFWKRWHITLGRFFTQNIYIPLGGNRRGAGRMYANFFLVFFLSGLWHGAGWNFILWGMLHGVLYILTKGWQSRRKEKSSCSNGLLRILSRLATFGYVSIAWVFFRAQTVGQATLLLDNIRTKPWGMPGTAMLEAFRLGEFWYPMKVLGLSKLPFSDCYLMVVFLVAALGILFFGKNTKQLAAEFKPTMGTACLTAILFLWSVVSLSGVSTFLYFNF